MQLTATDQAQRITEQLRATPGLAQEVKALLGADTNEEGVKPCPFCGCFPLFSAGNRWAEISCQGRCREAGRVRVTVGPGGQGGNNEVYRSIALARWNTRA
jgi:hypothetical protein